MTINAFEFVRFLVNCLINRNGPRLRHPHPFNRFSELSVLSVLAKKTFLRTFRFLLIRLLASTLVSALKTTLIGLQTGPNF